MAGSRRVQSARISTTWRLAKSASSVASAKVVFLLNWQVTHQAAVKSTNTGRPALSCVCTSASDQACQRGRSAAFFSLALLAVADEGASRKAKGSQLLPSHSKVARARPLMTQRVRPVRPSAQTSHATVSNKASRPLAPSMPVCWPSTHSSQITVANIGKAMAWRKVSIQAPGRGRARAMPGHQLAAK